MVQLTMKNSTCFITVQLSLSARFGTMNGLRLRDALTCLIFNVAHEKLQGIQEFKEEEPPFRNW